MPPRSASEIDEQLTAIEAVLNDAPQGMSRQQIEAALAARLGEELHPRTVQRRIKRLIEQGRAISEGPANAPIYLTQASLTEAAPPAETDDLAEEPGLVLSTDGRAVKKLVEVPIMQRRPVGYDRRFLEEYQPGRSWYLPERTREELHEWGRTPDRERPAGTFAREIYENLLIDLSWASSRLEGNTYSRLDTASLLKFGYEAEGKDATEAQMVLNHKQAIDFLIEEAENLHYDRRTLLTLHAMLAENLVGDPGDEGRLRRRMVQISGTTFTPVGIPQVIAECFDVFLARADAIDDPFEQAFFAMVHLPYLQPFIDVNKRTSRLAANISLIRANLIPLSFIDVPRRLYLQATMAVYETRRVEFLRDIFVWAYERSCAQYRVVRGAVVQPDAVRLRYRETLEKVVRELVLSKQAPAQTVIERWAVEQEIPTTDRDEFVQIARAILVSLNEGTAGRYRISSEEFEAWRRDLER